MPVSTAEHLKRAAIFVAVALVPVLVWLLFDVVLMAMGAILVAMLLSLGAEPFRKWLGLPRAAALLASGLVIACALGATGYLTVLQAGQWHEILQRTQQGIDSIRIALEGSDFGKFVLPYLQGGHLTLTAILTGISRVSLPFLTTLVVSVVGGIYLAAEAGVYRDGLIKLLPERFRADGMATLADVTAALRLWMLGQMIGMVLFGLMTTLATWLIGLPSPITLGLIAGIFEFIPYIGPILGAIPGVLVAITQGPEVVMWTIGAYVLIQQVEGHLIAPLISREMVYIPPLVLILGIVAITTLFGWQAAIFAAPIAVIIFVAVKKLYVRDGLGDSTPIRDDDNRSGRHRPGAEDPALPRDQAGMAAMARGAGQTDSGMA